MSIPSFIGILNLQNSENNNEGSLTGFYSGLYCARLEYLRSRTDGDPVTFHPLHTSSCLGTAEQVRWTGEWTVDNLSVVVNRCLMSTAPELEWILDRTKDEAFRLFFK